MWFRREKKMRAVTVDGNGKELGDERWVEIPKPDSFRSDGFLWIEDYLAGNGGVPDATRLLAYHLTPDVQFITALTKDGLREIYQLREQDALDFTYQEHHDAV